MTEHQPAGEDPNVALATEIAARLEEVEQEQAARRAAWEQADAAFGIELDAEIAAKRQSGAPAYADVARQGIDGRLDDAKDIITEVCWRYGARRAA